MLEKAAAVIKKDRHEHTTFLNPRVSDSDSSTGSLSEDFHLSSMSTAASQTFVTHDHPCVRPELVANLSGKEGELLTRRRYSLVEWLLVVATVIGAVHLVATTQLVHFTNNNITRPLTMPQRSSTMQEVWSIFSDAATPTTKAP
jgi:hypothetical protein